MADEKTNATANEKTNDKEVIILNKPFLGGWLDGEGRIGHEIIDFFLADNGKYYVYNNPRGGCPDEIYAVEDTVNNKTNKYLAKYMVLTSAAHMQEKPDGKKQDENDDNEQGDNDGSGENPPKKQDNPKNFNILYVIKLKRKIHSKHIGNDFTNNQTAIKKIIDKEVGTNEKTKEPIKGISYNGVPLYKIYPEDETLYLTFEAEAIYKVKENQIWLFEAKKYNFQRNKGYLWSDTDNKHNNKEDYDALANELKYEIDLADKKDSIGKLKKMELTRLEPEENNSDGVNNSYEKKTFLDLIGFTYNEQAFTNMLYALLKNNEVFNRFCKECSAEGEFIKGDYTVSREKIVENGRMDICGESHLQRVIIENKIYSGLNGIDKTNTTSQLSTYYNRWGKDGTKKEPLCFITAPDYRKSEIEVEIKKFDKEMEDKYHIITYSKIAAFFGKSEIKELFNKEENKLIYSLYDQIVNAFGKWSYNDKQDLYAGMFLAATEEANKRKQENK